MGYPPTVAEVVCFIIPGHKDTSVEVPPISRVMMSGNPACIPVWKAPTTPPAGPLKMVLTGCSEASFVVMLPPEDCMIRRLLLKEDSSRPRYSDIMGPT